MPTTLKDADFITKISTSGIRDHEHAFELMESFVGLDVGDVAFLGNGSVAASVISGSQEKIKTALSTLSPSDKAAAQTRFLVLKGQLAGKQNIHRIKKKVTSGEEKDTHSGLYDLATAFVKVIQDDLLPLFSVDVTPPAASPANLFEAVHTNDIALLLLPKIKESMSEELPIEGLTKSVVATNAFRTDLNSIYTLMWAQASADITFMKKKGLRDSPVIDLSSFIDDVALLPSLKLKLDPLYKKVRDVVRQYERAMDTIKDTGRWVKPKESKSSFDSGSNDQELKSDVPVSDYLSHDASITNLSVTDNLSHLLKMAVVDDQGHDCTGFVVISAIAGPPARTSMKLKTADLLKKYPDVHKLTIKRPMLLKGSWVNSSLDGSFPVDNQPAEFIDEIKFGGLEEATRKTMVKDFFVNKLQKDTLVLGLCTLEATTACKSVLKSLLKKEYSPAQEKYIHEALQLPVTETIVDPELACFTDAGVTATYADRLLYAYLLEKTEQSRTPEIFEKHIEELFATPKNLFARTLDKERCEEFTIKIDSLIAANPVPDISSLLTAYTAGHTDTTDLLLTANQPHPDAAKKTFMVNKFFDSILGSESYLGKKRRQFRLWRQGHSLLGDRIDFWNIADIHDYRFLMGLGDNQGDEEKKKVTLPGTITDYDDVDVRIHIESATRIDVDIDIPAQKGTKALQFDGSSGTPQAIRAEMDSSMVSTAGRDRKLAFYAKMQLENNFHNRLTQQHGDVSAHIIPPLPAPPIAPPVPALLPKIFTLRTGSSGVEVVDKGVSPQVVFTMEQCENEAQATTFLALVRKILDEHCKSMKTLLCNGANTATDVILDFPKLSTIEAANGATPDDFDGTWGPEEKKFGSTTIKVSYKSDGKGSYKLHISDGGVDEEFDSVGEVVMSVRYGSIALDIMHWFHEKLLEEFLLKRKDLPRDRTYLVQDAITGDWYGFYYEGTGLHYGLVESPPTGGVKGLSAGQKRKDVDPDPKQRCVMYAGYATFVKGSEDRAKKTIFGRKDIYYSLLSTAMATSISGPKERAYREEQRKKRAAETKSVRETLIDVNNWKNLYDIGKQAFKSIKK